MIYIIAYITALATFLIMDGIWLGYIAKGFYMNLMEPMMKENVKVLAAAGFYACYIAGVVYLIIKPQLLDSGSLQSVLITGAVLGIIAYGTYDMTNYALMKGFTWKLAWVDIVWGGVVTSTSAAAGYFAASKFAG